jgi:hypothetical protein
MAYVKAVDNLVKANIRLILNESDPTARVVGTGRLWAEDGIMNRPLGFNQGHEAINKAIHARFPGLEFKELGEAQVPPGPLESFEHGSFTARIKWSSEQKGIGPLFKGEDIAIVRGGKICALYGSLDS